MGVSKDRLRELHLLLLVLVHGLLEKHVVLLLNFFVRGCRCGADRYLNLLAKVVLQGLAESRSIQAKQFSALTDSHLAVELRAEAYELDVRVPEVGNAMVDAGISILHN